MTEFVSFNLGIMMAIMCISVTMQRSEVPAIFGASGAN